MKLQTCLEIGRECSLETVGESIYNINLHAGQIFAYSEIGQELKELHDEANKIFEKTGFTRDSGTADLLGWLLWEDDSVKISDLSL